MNTDRAQSDRHRHQCEVRFLLAASREDARGGEWVDAYLKHPKVAGRSAVLARDFQEQQARGNDGRYGLWI